MLVIAMTSCIRQLVGGILGHLATAFIDSRCRHARNGDRLIVHGDRKLRSAPLSARRVSGDLRE